MSGSRNLSTERRALRRRLIAERESLDAATLDRHRRLIDAHLERSFPGLGTARLAVYWPIRGEYDARPLAERLRERGATIALPVFVGPEKPLVFREWHPGVALATGAFGIPYPVSSEVLVPTAALVPMTGWDDAGYRLGYGGGTFDRTLSSLAKKAVAIGVGYEQGRLKTIDPQSWDVPMDWIVTERGVYRRDPEGLVFLDAPTAAIPGALASPTCYAAEVDPGYFDERPD